MASLQCGFARDFLSGLFSVSPVWVLSLFFKLPACENVFIHLEDLNALSPVWVLSCFFKWCDLEKFLSRMTLYENQIKCGHNSCWNKIESTEASAE